MLSLWWHSNLPAPQRWLRWLFPLPLNTPSWALQFGRVSILMWYFTFWRQAHKTPKLLLMSFKTSCLVGFWLFLFLRNHSYLQRPDFTLAAIALLLDVVLLDAAAPGSSAGAPKLGAILVPRAKARSPLLWRSQLPMSPQAAINVPLPLKHHAGSHWLAIPPFLS